MKKTIHTNLSLAALSLASIVTFSSCKDQSNTTGWNYNDKDNGGFSLADFKGQETGPGRVIVEAGSFTNGRVEEHFYQDCNNSPRQVTVSLFSMDANKVTNLDYMEYLYWLNRVFDRDYYPEIYSSALPGTLVWRS